MKYILMAVLICLIQSVIAQNVPGKVATSQHSLIKDTAAKRMFLYAANRKHWQVTVDNDSICTLRKNYKTTYVYVNYYKDFMTYESGDSAIINSTMTDMSQHHIFYLTQKPIIKDNKPLYWVHVMGYYMPEMLNTLP